jgi:uncharacterized OB-fold protein
MIDKEELPGTRLKKQDIEEGRVLTVRNTPEHYYARDLGIAFGRYLTELKRGRIIASKCKRCKRVVLPPRIFCEYCFRNMDEWVYLPDTGTLRTFSVVYIDADGERLKEPRLFAWVEIDGVSESIGLFAWLGEVEAKDVKCGMRVQAVWLPEKERKGDIMDIKYFKPL